MCGSIFWGILKSLEQVQKMSTLTRQFEMNLLKHMFARTVADKLWICHPWCWPNQDVQWIRTVTGNQKNVVWNATAIIAKWLMFPNSSMYNLTLRPAITKVHYVLVKAEFLLWTHVGLSFGGFAGSFLSGSGWLTTKWLTKPMMRRQKNTLKTARGLRGGGNWES